MGLTNQVTVYRAQLLQKKPLNRLCVTIVNCVEIEIEVGLSAEAAYIWGNCTTATGLKPDPVKAAAKHPTWKSPWNPRLFR